MLLKDIILFSTIIGTILLAILVPASGDFAAPYLNALIMGLLFMSFLKIDIGAVLAGPSSSITRCLALSGFKLIVFPIILFKIFAVAMPQYAVPVLLLSGVSTGVTAPFVSTLVFADVASVLRMAVVSSLLVPFSLPSLLETLSGNIISIPLATMMRMLAMVILVPMVFSWLIRRFLPQFQKKIERNQFAVSIVLLGLVNLGVFSKYSHFFFENPQEILMCMVVAYGIFAVSCFFGLFLTPSVNPPERMSNLVSLAFVNNVLVIVFSSEFFGPISPTLAAMYMFPYYSMIVPVRWLAGRRFGGRVEVSADK
jgi:bile acid:Na+ symporter, BASS family